VVSLTAKAVSNPRLPGWPRRHATRAATSLSAMSVNARSLPKNVRSLPSWCHEFWLPLWCCPISVHHLVATSLRRSELRAASVCATICLARSRSAFSTFSASRRVVTFVEP